MTSAEQVLVETSDGCRLEADLLRPDTTDPRGGIVVAHPHPLYGGDRTHPIVTSLTDAAAAAGYVALRFDFRGTGRSTGIHDKGTGEVNDMNAALAYVAAIIPIGTPLVAAGYSFGGAMALRSNELRTSHRIGVAAPLAMLGPGVAPLEPTLLIVPRHDQYTTPDQAAAGVATWPNPPTLEIIEGADHFLMGFTAEVTKRALAWLAQSAE